MAKATFSWLPPLPLPTPSAAYKKHLADDPAVVRLDAIGIDDEFAPGNHNGSSSGSSGSSGSGGGGGGQCPYIGLSAREGLLEPMLLWDASMAHSIATSLEADPQRLVVHVCGSFHCERRSGVTEMVEAYRGPKAGVKQLVVVFLPASDCDHFSAKHHAGRGDYVVLTDASVSRSHDYMKA